MASKTRKLRHALVERLKAVLGKTATNELLQKCAPELLKTLQPGDEAPMIASLLIDKIVGLALAPDKPNQWAVELVFSYIEGKPVQGAPKREEARVIEERLDDITVKHLDSIAAGFIDETGSGRAEPDLAVRADGQAAEQLDLPSDGPASSEGIGGQPEMAKAAAAQSG